MAVCAAAQTVSSRRKTAVRRSIMVARLDEPRWCWKAGKKREYRPAGLGIGQVLQLVLLHQVAEGAVGDSQHAGRFDLDAVRLPEGGLQQ